MYIRVEGKTRHREKTAAEAVPEHFTSYSQRGRGGERIYLVHPSAPRRIQGRVTREAAVAIRQCLSKKNRFSCTGGVSRNEVAVRVAQRVFLFESTGLCVIGVRNFADSGLGWVV